MDRARVEPGLVRDELNALLKPHGLNFTPDPATSSRANIGGMIQITNGAGRVAGQELTVFYGSMTEDGIVYKAEFDEFERAIPRLRIVHVITNPTPGNCASGVTPSWRWPIPGCLPSSTEARPAGQRRDARRRKLHCVGMSGCRQSSDALPSLPT